MSVPERAKQHELGRNKDARPGLQDNAPRPKPSERKGNAGSESAPRVGFRLGVLQNKSRGSATRQMRGPDQYTALGWQRRARAGLGEA